MIICSNGSRHFLHPRPGGKGLIDPAERHTCRPGISRPGSRSPIRVRERGVLPRARLAIDALLPNLPSSLLRLSESALCPYVE